MKIDGKDLKVEFIDNNHAAYEAAIEVYDDDPPYILGSELWGLVRGVNSTCKLYLTADTPRMVVVEYQSGYRDIDAYRLHWSEYEKFLGYCDKPG